MSSKAVWVVGYPDQNVVRRLGDALDGPTPLATVLTHRGLGDPADAGRFLNPSPGEIHPPSSLPDLDATVNRLGRA